MARSRSHRQSLNVSFVPAAVQEYFDEPCILHEDSLVVL